MQITAQVLLNTKFHVTDTSMFEDAGRVTVTIAEGLNPHAALEKIFAVTNQGSGMECADYFSRGNRSLSVADVVVHDGVAFEVAPLGFKPVRISPAQVIRP